MAGGVAVAELLTADPAGLFTGLFIPVPAPEFVARAILVTPVADLFAVLRAEMVGLVFLQTDVGAPQLGLDLIAKLL